MPRRHRGGRISSFSYLNVAQFCGALNDNLFKLLIVFLIVHLKGREVVTEIMITTGATFIVPYLILSIPAGTLADRFSKRNIIVWIKGIEMLLMSFGVLVFWMQSIWGSYLVLFLMSIQSALFSPSKYGIVPELVKRDRISWANGVLTGYTIIATIAGSTLASLLSQATDHNFPLAAGFAVLVSIVGFAGSLGIGYTPPSGSKRKASMRVISETLRVLKRSRTENYLFAAIFGSSLFYTIGAYMQLNIIPFSVESLDLTSEQGNYIFGVAAVGIACGAYISGRMSGRDVEIGISPLAGLGIFAFLFLLFVFQYYLITVIVLFFFLGLLGGMFLVPFDAYIQVASPDEERGENVAASNFLSFVGIALGIFLLFLFSEVFGWTAAEGFVGMSVLTLLVAIYLFYRLSDTFVRLRSRFKYGPKYRPKIEGSDLLVRERPSLLLCPAQDWNFALILMTSIQQRYMKFALERPETLSAKNKWLLRFAKVVLYETSPQEAAPAITRWLKRGYSVTILPKTMSPETVSASQAIVKGTDISLIQADLQTNDPIQISLSPCS